MERLIMKLLTMCRKVVALSVVTMFFHVVRSLISAVMYVQALRRLQRDSRISLA